MLPFWIQHCSFECPAILYDAAAVTAKGIAPPPSSSKRSILANDQIFFVNNSRILPRNLLKVFKYFYFW